MDMTGWVSALAIVLAFVVAIFLIGRFSRKEKRPKSPDAPEKDRSPPPTRGPS
jgi:hypothetical protein